MKTYNRLFLFLAALIGTSTAMAEEAATATASGLAPLIGSTTGLVALGTGIMMGLAVLGGTLGQGKAASAALDGVARNPAAAKQIQGPLILSLALMESLVLFALLIAFGMSGSVNKAFELLAK